MPTCEVCGGENFHLEDGLFYCSECLTQTQDAREEAEDVEFADQSIMKQVTSGKAKGTTKKRETLLKEFEPWLTIEAYNVIIKKQVDALMVLGASPKLAETVLQLWATYLRICEIAFICDSERSSKPKLPTIPRYRDYEILQGCKILSGQGHFFPEIRKRTYIMKGGKTFTYNRHRPVKNSNVSIKRRYMRERARNKIKCESEHSKKRKVKNLILQESQQMSLEASQSILIDSPDEELISDEEILDTSKLTKKRKLRLSYTKSRKNEFSKVAIRKLNKKDLTFWKTRNKGFGGCTDSMTLGQTICFCYAGILLLQDPILLSDILRWIREGHIPFLNAYLSLPPQMIGQKHDFQPFRTNSLPERKYLLKETKQLLQFVSVNQVPRQSILPVVLRVVIDLNLPLSLVRITNSLIQKCHGGKLDKEIGFGEANETVKLMSKKNLPQVELQAAALILIVLKIIFGLDGTREREESMKAAAASDGKTLPYFQWIEWQKCVQSKIHFVKTTFPHSLLFDGSTFTDVESFCSFYKEVYTPAKENEGPKLDLRTRVMKHERVTDRQLNQSLKKLFIGLRPAEPEIDMEIDRPAKPTSFPLTRIKQHVFLKPGAKMIEDFSKYQLLPQNQKKVKFWLLKETKAGDAKTDILFKSLPESFQTFCRLVFLVYECNARNFLSVLYKLEQAVIQS